MGRPVLRQSEVMARPVAGAELVADLRRLGIAPRPLMAHVSMSAIGWVVGGAQTLIEALLTATGGHALLALTGWEDRPPYHQDDWPDHERLAYSEGCPAFDPRKARAEREHGRFAETVRTWPGASHSAHPVSGFAAVGLGAEWLVGEQSLDEGYGAQSPLARLVESGGSVLVLGAPLEHLTVLHHAEYLVESPARRWNEYEMPVLVHGERVWRRIRDLDSSRGAFRYEDLALEADAFEVIGRDALDRGVGRTGMVGDATSHLFPARALVEHATAWLRARFP